MTKKIDPITLQVLAKDLARDYHENHFQSRRGIGLVGDYVFIHNNNPYANDVQRRRNEFAHFIDWCEGKGIKVLADESYGEYVADENYTRVVILDADESMMHEVGNAYRDCSK